jgi:hypothetical protein
LRISCHLACDELRDALAHRRRRECEAGHTGVDFSAVLGLAVGTVGAATTLRERV